MCPLVISLLGVQRPHVCFFFFLSFFLFFFCCCCCCFMCPLVISLLGVQRRHACFFFFLSFFFFFFFFFFCCCCFMCCLLLYLFVTLRLRRSPDSLTFMSGKNSILGLSEPKKSDFLVFYVDEHLKFQSQS